MLLKAFWREQMGTRQVAACMSCRFESECQSHGNFHSIPRVGVDPSDLFASSATIQVYFLSFINAVTPASLSVGAYLTR